MFGWFKPEAVCASRSNRFRQSMLPVNPAGKNLRATYRLRLVFSARWAGAVKPILRSSEAKSKIITDAVTDGSGTYQFRNLTPGNYTPEIDSATLPVNFRLPASIKWEIKIEPLQEFCLDIPIAVQRAVTAFVFVDKDDDGKFNSQIDESVAGANVSANGSAAISGGNGAYILRNLPAGQIKILVRSPLGTQCFPVFWELGAEPVTKRAFNPAIRC